MAVSLLESVKMLAEERMEEEDENQKQQRKAVDVARVRVAACRTQLGGLLEAVKTLAEERVRRGHRSKKWIIRGSGWGGRAWLGRG